MADATCGKSTEVDLRNHASKNILLIAALWLQPALESEPAPVLALQVRFSEHLNQLPWQRAPQMH